MKVIMKRTYNGQVEKLSNGSWSHTKTAYEFDNEIDAITDYRFCCDWEGVPSKDHTESDFQ